MRPTTTRPNDDPRHPPAPGPPVVTLRSASARPYDGAIAAARTCYSPRVIGAEEVTARPARVHRPPDLRGRPPHRLPARALRVRAREREPAVRVVVPALASLLQLRAVQPALRAPGRGRGPRARTASTGGRAAVYEDAVDGGLGGVPRAGRDPQGGHATRIMAEPAPPLAAARRRSGARRSAREAEKKAIELARYVIPVAAFTSMVHTVSGIVLHRLYRMMRTGDTPAENVARRRRRWSTQVRALDPAFFEKVGRRPARSRATWSRRAGPRVARRRRRRGRRASTRGSGARASLLVDYIRRARRRRRRTRCARCSGAAPDALSDDGGAGAAAQPVAEPLPAGDAATSPCTRRSAARCTTRATRS